MKNKLYQYVSICIPKNEDQEEEILKSGFVLAENIDSARIQVARDIDMAKKSEEIKIFIKEFVEESSYYIKATSGTVTIPSYGSSSLSTNTVLL